LLELEHVPNFVQPGRSVSLTSSGCCPDVAPCTCYTCCG
jgi:hypothetical protein